jgi:hypothetical protein
MARSPLALRSTGRDKAAGGQTGNNDSSTRSSSVQPSDNSAGMRSALAIQQYEPPGLRYGQNNSGYSGQDVGVIKYEVNPRIEWVTKFLPMAFCGPVNPFET